MLEGRGYIVRKGGQEGILMAKENLTEDLEERTESTLGEEHV